MTVKHKFSHKIISVFLCVTLLLSYLPFTGITASADASPLITAEKITDTPTVNQWQEIFTDDSTENAGGVWTDKSVFENPQDYLNATAEAENYTPTMLDAENNFLVSLSAIASNKQVTGYSTAPTDTVLVLDLSSSMQGYNYNSILPLANASNNAIKELLALNKNNRVSVVLYSGADENSDTLQTRILLPLDRYTTTDAEGDFLEYKTINGEEGIGVVSGVRNSANQSNFGLRNNQSSWSRGTFTQDGIYVATNILMDAEQYVEDGNIQAGQERMPIMVLMSDGEPSLLSTDYAEGTYDSDDGLYHLTSKFSGGTYATGTDTEFMVQLSAAWAKYRIEQKYKEHDLLFYSLGLRGNSNFATTILDPASHTSTDSYWERYLNDNTYKNWTITNTKADFSYQITTSDTIRANLKSAVTSTAAEDLRSSGLNKYRYYIDKYFEATTDAALEGVFDEIVDEIILQSRYYPTNIEEGTDINYGGYLTIVDTLGKYMDVKDLKNLQLGSEPFFGRNAAMGLSTVTSYDNLTGTSADLFDAVVARLHTDKDTALEVITAAQNSGLLYYNSDSDFKNSIGWYGNYTDSTVDALYVSPWNGDDDSVTPAGANCTIESYYFYGQGSLAQRVADMRYIEVEVVHMLITGETKVRIRIPASLIPLITYEVRLDGETLLSPVDSLTVDGATAPIRLLYEVGLKDGINSLNVSELASDAYNSTTGKYEFYSNKWNYSGGSINIGVTPPKEVGNSYSYYEPSSENEYMYYQYDTIIYQYVGGEYVVYNGDTQPSGEGFYGIRYTYTKPATGSTSQPLAVYPEIDNLHLSEAEKITENGDTYWVLPKGAHVLANGSKVINYKDGDTAQTADGGPTGTYKTFSTYYIMHTNHEGTPVYNMETALGNNGKLSLEALSGIRLQKIVPENSGITTDEDYVFTVTPADGSGITLSGEYRLYVVEGIDNDATGGAVEIDPVTANNNSLTVTLKANQTLYIADLPAGDYTVTEALGEAYTVSAINGIETTRNSTAVTVEGDKFTTTSFTNVARSTAHFTISKIVDYPEGLSEEAVNIITNKEFSITAKFVLNGENLANKTFYEVIDGDVSDTVSVTTNANGEITFTLKHNEQITLADVPIGTVITATETLATADRENYKVTYFENGVAGANDYGKVTVADHNTVSIIVDNEYLLMPPAEVDIEVAVTKVVDDTSSGGFDWTDTSFKFVLQKYNPESLAEVKWENISEEVSISQQNGIYTFKIGSDGITAEDFTFDKIGTYYFRVKEIVEEMPGMIFDTQYHSFTVYVNDTNGDGDFEVTITPRANASDTAAVQVNTYTAPSGTETTHTFATTFTNIYDPEHAVAEIIANKTVENTSGTQNLDLGGFEFKVYEIDANGDVIGSDAVASATTTQIGVAKMTLPYYDETGTYRYVVKETVVTGSNAKSGWQYNAPDVYVNVVVTGGAGSLEAVAYLVNKDGTVIGTQNNTSALSISFKNTYAPIPATLDIPVSKHLSGRTLKDGEFKFQLVDAAGQFNPVVLQNALTVTNSSNAKFNLNFSKVGTYFYDITEDATFDGDGDGKAGVVGVGYDKTTFRVAVTVVDNGGTLSASFLVANIQGNTIVFENTFTPNPITNTISGTKILTGRNLRNSEFTFILTEAVNANGDTVTGAKTYTAKNTVSAGSANKGTFTFPEIIYTDAGTHYYVVTERVGVARNGITYNIGNKKYVVTVNVTKNSDGQLRANSSHSANEIVFNNLYKAASTSIDITGLKTLTGNRYLQANDFSFEMYTADSTYAYSGTPLTAANDEQGHFTFRNIEFANTGTYYYVVKEFIPDEKINGVTYDTAQYNISVNVTDNLNGKLVAETPVISRVTEEGTQSAVAVAFYNDYVADNASINLGGVKHLEGRTLLTDEFTFTLNAANEDFNVESEIPAVQVKNAADGTFNFGEITFSEEGNYYYVISEDTTQTLERVTYDNTLYYVEVTVTDDIESGKLIADYTVRTENGEVEKIVFTNKYTPKPTDITVDINIDKKVENKGSQSITAEGFEFALSKEGTTEVTTVKSDKNGKAVLTLGFTENDIGNTYNYILEEVAGDTQYVKYSSVKYAIAISISLNGENQLVAEITKDGVATEEITAEFINEYDYTPVVAEPEPEEPAQSTSPKTGDLSNLQLWIALLFVSGGLMGATAFRKGKKQRIK